LNRPEPKKIELDIGIKEDKTIVDLRNTMKELAVQQQTLMTDGGMNARDVAHSKLIIDGDFVEA
jgi:hypothetical protein